MHVMTADSADVQRRSIRSLLDDARQRTLLLVGSLTEDDLRLQHDPLMSPILWDLGHNRAEQSTGFHTRIKQRLQL